MRRFIISRNQIRAIVVLGLLVTAILSLSDCRSADEKGADLWRGLQRDLAERQIVRVELQAPGPLRTDLTGAEARHYSAAFLSGTFSESNPNSYGPTADVVVLLTYEGGETVTPNQWPDGRFEVRRDGLQFLVSCPQLASLLQQRGFVYSSPIPST